MKWKQNWKKMNITIRQFKGKPYQVESHSSSLSLFRILYSFWFFYPILGQIEAPPIGTSNREYICSFQFDYSNTMSKWYISAWHILLTLKSTSKPNYLEKVCVSKDNEIQIMKCSNLKYTSLIFNRCIYL